MSENEDIGAAGVGLVRIVVPPSDRCMASALGTKVIAGDGMALPGVYSVKIRPLTAEGLVVAEIEVALDGLDIEAHPFAGARQPGPRGGGTWAAAGGCAGGRDHGSCILARLRSGRAAAG